MSKALYKRALYVFGLVNFIVVDLLLVFLMRDYREFGVFAIWFALVFTPLYCVIGVAVLVYYLARSSEDSSKSFYLQVLDLALILLSSFVIAFIFNPPLWANWFAASQS